MPGFYRRLQRMVRLLLVHGSILQQGLLSSCGLTSVALLSLSRIRASKAETLASM